MRRVLTGTLRKITPNADSNMRKASEEKNNNTATTTTPITSLSSMKAVTAVVNVPAVFEKLDEGQKITVDGTRGVVWLDPR